MPDDERPEPGRDLTRGDARAAIEDVRRAMAVLSHLAIAGLLHANHQSLSGMRRLSAAESIASDLAKVLALSALQLPEGDEGDVALAAAFDTELDELRRVVVNTATDIRILERALHHGNRNAVDSLVEQLRERFAPYDVGGVDE